MDSPQNRFHGILHLVYDGPEEGRDDSCTTLPGSVQSDGHPTIRFHERHVHIETHHIGADVDGEFVVGGGGISVGRMYPVPRFTELQFGNR